MLKVHGTSNAQKQQEPFPVLPGECSEVTFCQHRKKAALERVIRPFVRSDCIQWAARKHRGSTLQSHATMKGQGSLCSQTAQAHFRKLFKVSLKIHKIY